MKKKLKNIKNYLKIRALLSSSSSSSDDKYNWIFKDGIDKSSGVIVSSVSFSCSFGFNWVTCGDGNGGGGGESNNNFNIDGWIGGCCEIDSCCDVTGLIGKGVIRNSNNTAFSFSSSVGVGIICWFGGSCGATFIFCTIPVIWLSAFVFNVSFNGEIGKGCGRETEKSIQREEG